MTASVETSPDHHRPPGAALGVATVLMTLIGWSSVPLFINHFANSIDLWTSNGWRYAFSALLWAPVLVWGAFRGGLPAGLWRASLVPAALNAVGQTGFAWSFYNLDPATATFGLRMQIVFVAVGAYLLFPSERAVLRSRATWIGIALVTAGVLGTVIWRDDSNAPTPVAGRVSAEFGLTMAVLSGLCFAAYGLSVRRSMGGYHPVTAFAAISQFTAAIIIGLMLAFARDPRSGGPDFGASILNLSGGQIALLLLSAVIGIALGHVFYYISIARLGVAVSSGVLQLQPFCVAMGQYLVFDKLLTAGQWVSGAAAVIGAVMLLAVQWRLTRAAAGARALSGEFVAGSQSVGVEAAEMDALPVDLNGAAHNGEGGAGDRQASMPPRGPTNVRQT